MSESVKQTQTHAEEALGVAVVIGDGWSALSAVATALDQYSKVIWAAGTSARLLPVTASLEAGEGSDGWIRLAAGMDMDLGPFQAGSFLREFRNKAFHPPEWFTAASEQDRTEVRDEMLWLAERQAAPLREGRFEKTFLEIEGDLRAMVLAHPRLVRREGAPMKSYAEMGGTAVVTLANGEVFSASRVIYADTLSSLRAVEGLPKEIKVAEMARKWQPMSCVQVEFTHAAAAGNGASESFYMKSPKDAGETMDRHVWGYFLADGKKSVWTFFLAPDEAEDNHEIAKKLRRIKQCLNKMFGTPEWLPAGKSEFTAGIAGERVTFHEGYFFAQGALDDVKRGARGDDVLSVCVDGFGPSMAMQQVIQALPAAGATSDSPFEIPAAVSESAAETVGAAGNIPTA
ncbi:MAG: hypothetical protein AB7P04_02490 [Bacteriovoracia bacterium]